MIKNGLYRDYLKDIQEFNRLYAEYLKGEAFESDFKNFRLTNGIYGQRQKDFHMVRIKIPAGVLTPAQIYTIADIGDRYSNGVAHITTRQDIQFHWIKLEDVPEIIKTVNEAGLTTKDACGNTLRNITASYLSGVCPEEVIEVERIAVKLTEMLIGKYENLPRKFKIGFSCCEKHSFLIPFNDVGFIPVLRNNKVGFKVYIGGGLGDRPKYAFEYTDFLPIEQLLLFVQSVMDVFDQYGDRKNRRHNRLKFLIEKLGKEKFLSLLEEQINKNSKDFTPFQCDAPIYQPSQIVTDLPVSSDHHQNLWLKTNVVPQKQENLFTAVVKLKLGNITTGKLRSIGDIAEKFSLTVKTTPDQNIALLNIHRDILDKVYSHLKEVSLADFGASTYLDITACPGSETCSLGITSSRDLARAIQERLPTDSNSVEKLKNVTIKVSGCPNSCAHHHVASIGLHGIAMKVEDRLIPAYVIHLGGNGSLTKQKIGYTGIKIPAKNVPDAVIYLLETYIKESRENESFEDFVERTGIQELNRRLERFKEFYKKEPYTHDWGSDKEFSLEDIGKGECAGIIADRVEEALKEGERLIKQAETHINKGYIEDSIPHIEKAVDIISEGLLIPFGIKASGKDAREKFIEEIIGRNLVDRKFVSLLSGNISSIAEMLESSKQFYQQSKNAYLKLRKQTEEKKEEESGEKARKEVLDLRGVECPFNYVKAKYKLREMDTGSILVILIDGEESIRSVPQSLKDDGHEIIDIQEEKDNYVVVVRKR